MRNKKLLLRYFFNEYFIKCNNKYVFESVELYFEKETHYNKRLATKLVTSEKKNENKQN